MGRTIQVAIDVGNGKCVLGSGYPSERTMTAIGGGADADRVAHWIQDWDWDCQDVEELQRNLNAIRVYAPHRLAEAPWGQVPAQSKAFYEEWKNPVNPDERVVHSVEILAVDAAGLALISKNRENTVTHSRLVEESVVSLVKATALIAEYEMIQDRRRAYGQAASPVGLEIPFDRLPAGMVFIDGFGGGDTWLKVNQRQAKLIEAQKFGRNEGAEGAMVEIPAEWEVIPSVLPQSKLGVTQSNAQEAIVLRLDDEEKMRSFNMDAIAKKLVDKELCLNEVVQISPQAKCYCYGNDSLHLYVNDAGVIMAIKDPKTRFQVIYEGPLSELSAAAKKTTKLAGLWATPKPTP